MLLGESRMYSKPLNLKNQEERDRNDESISPQAPLKMFKMLNILEEREVDEKKPTVLYETLAPRSPESSYK